MNTEVLPKYEQNIMKKSSFFDFWPYFTRVSHSHKKFIIQFDRVEVPLSNGICHQAGEFENVGKLWINFFSSFCSFLVSVVKEVHSHRGIKMFGKHLQKYIIEHIFYCNIRIWNEYFNAKDIKFSNHPDMKKANFSSTKKFAKNT